MVIEVSNLVKHYGSVKAVDDITFRVNPGEIFGMLGPNGAGKTTTVEIIEGLRAADSGHVSVMGLDISKVPNRIKQKIGIHFRSPCGFEGSGKTLRVAVEQLARAAAGLREGVGSGRLFAGLPHPGRGAAQQEEARLGQEEAPEGKPPGRRAGGREQAGECQAAAQQPGFDAEAPPEAPAARRGDAPAPAHDARPQATRATLEELRERGMGSVRVHWPTQGEPDRYVRDLDALPELIRTEAGGFANPAFTLGLANWALVANVRLGPWIHAESRVQNRAPIPRSSALVVESGVADLFERRGHEFVELDVTVFLEPDTPVMSTRHRAIYKLSAP